MSDITYCASNCCNTNCIRHKSKANKYSSWADLSGDCDDYKSYGDWWQERKKDNSDNDNIEIKNNFGII